MLASITSTLITLLVWVIIIQAIMSWLLAFNVVNYHNRVVNMIWTMTNQLTEPLLRPIRSFMPNLGGLDISPVILIVVLHAVNVYMIMPLT